LANALVDNRSWITKFVSGIKGLFGKKDDDPLAMKELGKLFDLINKNLLPFATNSKITDDSLKKMDYFVSIVDKVIAIIIRLSDLTKSTTDKLLNNLQNITDEKFINNLIGSLTTFYVKLTQKLDAFID
jgi:hypothetical protein